MRRTAHRLAAAAFLGLGVAAIFAHQPARAAKPSAGYERPLLERAAEARGLEDLGAYTRAVEALKVLRASQPLDADLEIALALDEARSGMLDSAAARLRSPLLERAAVDSMPVTRRDQYSWRRDGTWVTGAFEGWYWYVWRARAEVQAALGHWIEALRRDAWRHGAVGKECSCSRCVRDAVDTRAKLAPRPRRRGEIRRCPRPRTSPVSGLAQRAARRSGRALSRRRDARLVVSRSGARLGAHAHPRLPARLTAYRVLRRRARAGARDFARPAEARGVRADGFAGARPLALRSTDPRLAPRKDEAKRPICRC